MAQIITEKVESEWIGIGRSTAPIDKAAAEAAVLDLYRYAGVKKPEVVFYPSPFAAREDYLRYLKKDPPSRFAPRRTCTPVLQTLYETKGKGGENRAGRLSQLLGLNIYGPVLQAMGAIHPRSLSAGRYSCTRALIKMDEDVRKVCVAQARHCSVWFPYTDVAMISEHPTQLSLDVRGRLHNTEGPALSYADGQAIYSVGGVVMPPEYILLEPSLWAIQQEDNTERRRVLIDRYGWDRYIVDSGAQPIQKDKFGALYEIEVGQSRVRMALVTNSSPEPDGTFKKYALKVNPRAMTCKEAVAGTFGLLDDSTYKPRIQT